MVALLLFPIKNDNIPLKPLDEPRQTNQQLLNEVLWLELHPLSIKQHPSAESGYYNVFCRDGNFRLSKPVLAAWNADCLYYSDLHHLKRHV
jgi:hypothetical protein